MPTNKLQELWLSSDNAESHAPSNILFQRSTSSHHLPEGQCCSEFSSSVAALCPHHRMLHNVNPTGNINRYLLDFAGGLGENKYRSSYNKVCHSIFFMETKSQAEDFVQASCLNKVHLQAKLNLS